MHIPKNRVLIYKNIISNNSMRHSISSPRHLVERICQRHQRLQEADGEADGDDDEVQPQGQVVQGQPPPVHRQAQQGHAWGVVVIDVLAVSKTLRDQN